MPVVVRQLDAVVDAGLERELGKQVLPAHPERHGIEGAGLNPVPIPEDLLKALDARVADAYAGRVRAAGRVGAYLRLGLRDDLALEAEIDEESRAIADDRTADREGPAPSW